MRWKNYYANWKKPYVKGRAVYNPMHIQNRQIIRTESRCVGVHSAEVSGEQALMGQALPGSEENALWGWEHFVNVWKGANWVLSILQINALLNNLQPGFCRKKKIHRFSEFLKFEKQSVYSLKRMLFVHQTMDICRSGDQKCSVKIDIHCIIRNSSWKNSHSSRNVASV